MTDAGVIREAIRCTTCALMQYRTRDGNCRRCLRPLPSKLESVVPTGGSREVSSGGAQRFLKSPNVQAVEKIGQRIRELRKSRGLTQIQLQMLSRVSRSYLARVETGLMIPSLRTVEKIAEALGVALNQLFITHASRETLMEDPFVHGLQRYLRRLGCEQWQSVLRCLAAINHTPYTKGARIVPPASKGNSRIANFSGRSNLSGNMKDESGMQVSC